jgi:hypothetical protein
MMACQRNALRAAVLLTVLAATTTDVSAQAASAPAGFRSTIEAPGSGSEMHASISRWLHSTRMLERVAEMMNQAFQWPAQITLSAGECGQSNATYERSPSGGTIRVCYEFVQEIVEEFQYHDLTSIDRGMAQSGTLMFVLLHEVGHALVDQFHLSVASAEQAADQFATHILSAGDPRAAYWATEYWRRGGTAESFAATDAFSRAHTVDAARLYDVLCWIYGADPAGRSDLIRGNGFPAQRSVTCANEYLRMATAWEKLLSPLTALASARAR